MSEKGITPKSGLICEDKTMNRIINTVDTHTMGEPTRIVTGGVRHIPGATLREKKKHAAQHMDDIRTSLMHEPRGHKDMFGAIMVPPVMPDADLGVIFMDSGGYLDMCGHGLIGFVTAAVETGLIPQNSGKQSLKVETPAGIIDVTVDIRDARAKSVSFQNVPSFLHQTDVPVQIEGKAPIKADIAYGGNYFALVDADKIDLVIDLENTNEIVTVGMAVLEKINNLTTIKHPQTGETNQVNLVEFYTARHSPEANAKNTVVFGNGQIDRSPCGTGTCAKMAYLFAKGELDLNELFIHESIIGTRFSGRLLETIHLGQIDAVIPEITASAFITGIHQFYIHPEDPLKHGFQL